MKFTISLGQMRIEVGKPEVNLERMADWTAEAGRRGSALVLFPELCSTGYDLENCARYAASPGRGVFQSLASLARERHIAIGGSILEACEGRVYNCFALFNAEGQLAATYRKAHLFRLMQEDKWLEPGNRLETVETDWGRTGLAICYDLRFPEMFRRYALAGARFILLSAEWPSRRARHWDILLRARAIENQMFIAACNCVGELHGEHFGGGSAIIDPWGDALVAGDDSEGLLTAELDLDKIDQVRDRINVFADRRPDLY
jgi:omega-amidase